MCGHWQSEYDPSPCDYCALEAKAAAERQIYVDSLKAANKELWEALKNCKNAFNGALAYKPASLVKKHADYDEVREYELVLERYKEKT